MNDSKRTTTSKRPKYMREVVCEICGAMFMGGSNARMCPECSQIYRRRYSCLLKARDRIGDGSRDALRAASAEHVRKVRMIAPSPACAAPPAHATCGYCGRELGPREVRRGYCGSCVAHGYHWLHEVTGRTRRGASDELP